MILKVVVPGLQFRLLQRESSFWFSRQGEVHYIGGTDVLPPPLSQEEENERISQLATDMEKDAKQVLIEHNLRLVVYIAKKFDNINTYNPEKNIKLATYASRCIENEILMYLRRNNKVRMEVSIDEPLNVDWDGNELLLSDILGTDEDIIYKDMENEAEQKMLKKALSKLSDREKLIISLRFGLNNREEEAMTQKEVADLLGISQSYISRLEKKIMKRLKKEMV